MIIRQYMEELMITTSNSDEFMDEIAVTIEEKIDYIRDTLNMLMSEMYKHTDSNIILKTSTTLDALINLYYKQRK